jgi:hypothetical protein
MYTGLGLARPGGQPVIVLLILVSTWSLLRESLRMVLAAVPANVDARQGAPSWRAAGRGGDPRPAHLGHEHHRNGADGAPGDAGRLSGRPADRRHHGHAEQEFAIHHCTLQVEHGHHRARLLAAPAAHDHGHGHCGHATRIQHLAQVGVQRRTQIALAERRDDRDDHLARVLGPARDLQRRPQAAPDEIPTSRPSSRAAARAVAKASSFFTVMTSS